MKPVFKNNFRESLKTLRAEYFFLVTAVFFELLLNLVTPPLQSPDEINHFYRAYQVSEGKFAPVKRDQRLGGDMPYCFKEFASILEPVSGNEYYRIKREDLNRIFKVKLDAGKREFQDFPNTANYSAVSYLPQALSMFILRQFDVSVGTLYYGGRFSIFLVWLLCMFFAIRMLPVYKWFFTLLILLPMNIYISNSFSADTVTNILSFLLIAFVLKQAFGTGKVQMKQLLVILLLGIMLASAKILYVGLVLLILIIPAAKFSSRQFRFAAMAVLFFITFFTAYLSSGAVMKYYISYINYNPLYRDLSTLATDADYYVQKAYSLQHKGYLLSVFFETVTDYPSFYLLSYIGGFGTFLHLFMPWWICVIAYAFILFMVLTEQKKLFTIFQKAVFLGVACLTLGLLILSQHLTWNAVGQHGLLYIQGRYLIPVFPLLFLLFNGAFLKIKLRTELPVVLFVVFVNIYAICFLYYSYVADHHYSETQFFCDAEQTDASGRLTTTNSTVSLGGGEGRSTLEHRSGKHAVALTPANAFAFTYNFTQFDKRDMVDITAWQKGEGGVLVISGNGDQCGEFYFPNPNICYEDSNGWKKMHMVLSMWKSCGKSSAGFYIFNSGQSTIYFDDVSFSIKKFKEGAVYFH